MTGHDDRDLDAVNRQLAKLFGEEPGIPPEFTRQVLRRIQEARWRRETILDRVFYAGLAASGVLAIIGTWFAVGAVLGALHTSSGAAVGASIAVPLSGDAAMKIAVAGLAVTAVATWRRLAGRS